MTVRGLFGWPLEFVISRARHSQRLKKYRPSRLSHLLRNVAKQQFEFLKMRPTLCVWRYSLLSRYVIQKEVVRYLTSSFEYLVGIASIENAACTLIERRVIWDSTATARSQQIIKLRNDRRGFSIKKLLVLSWVLNNLNQIVKNRFKTQSNRTSLFPTTLRIAHRLHI